MNVKGDGDGVRPMRERKSRRGGVQGGKSGEHRKRSLLFVGICRNIVIEMPPHSPATDGKLLTRFLPQRLFVPACPLSLSSTIIGGIRCSLAALNTQDTNITGICTFSHCSVKKMFLKAS